MARDDNDMPDDVATLRALLQDKIKLLIQRERDVHTLVRRVNESNRWMQVVAEISARVGSYHDEQAALDTLAEALAESLGFEYALAVWGDRVSECPSLSAPNGLRELLIGLAAQPYDAGVQLQTWTTGPVRMAFRFAMQSTLVPHESIVVVVARSPRTAEYHTIADETTHARLARLGEQLAQSFDSVRLRREVMRERDSLQDAVIAATLELRAAVRDAESARAAAVHAATARTEFLANMSHEIRTPMTAVLGYAALLQDADLGLATRREYLETITRSGRHLLSLLDDILNLARIESGHLTVNAEPTAVHSLMLELQALLAVKAAEKGLELTVRFATSLPSMMHVDAARLRQILINLIGNSIKFTERGRVAVVASMIGTDRLKIEVIDTGPGIAADKQKLIFEAFEQGNQGMSRSHGGAGLGLAIARKLARLLGGDIAMYSQLGHGSIFTVTVGVAVDVDAIWTAAPRVTNENEPAMPIALNALVQGRVLVVDDTPINRNLFSSILVRAGLNVREACNGKEALEMVVAAAQADHPFDMVFMDMQMPVMDGYEATRRIRATVPALPIIALTAHSMAGDRERCLDAGCTEYLAKPIERPELIRMARRFSRTTDAPAVILPFRAPPRSTDRLKANAAVDESVLELMPTFIATLRENIVELERAQQGHDVNEIASIAHRIKGTAATFGYPSISDLAAEVERLAKADASPLANVLPDLLRECRRAV